MNQKRIPNEGRRNRNLDLMTGKGLLVARSLLEVQIVGFAPLLNRVHVQAQDVMI